MSTVSFPENEPGLTSQLDAFLTREFAPRSSLS